jgi:outer membrane protein TolC
MACGQAMAVQAQPPHHPRGFEASSAREWKAGGDLVTLEELIREAVENNAGLQAALKNVEARREMVVPAETLPDPTVGFLNMGDLIPPTLQQGDPSSGRTFSIEQEIPFPGKLGLRGKIAGMEAEAEQWSAEQTRLQVIADVKTAYYDYFLVMKSQEIVAKDKELVHRFARIAEEKYRVGEGLQQDVLKAQVEVAKLIDRMTVLEQRRGGAVAQINGLLNRPAASPLGRPADLRKAQLRYSAEEIVKMAEGGTPTLRARERDIDRSQYAVELSRKNFYPDFSVGFSYVDRTMPEMYGLALNVKVPLYFWRRQAHELRSAQAALDGSRKQYQDTLASTAARIQESHLAATSAERLVELYGGAIIPQAKLALESAAAGYQVGTLDFLTLIDSLVTVLEYEIKYYEVLTDFHKALARIELLVGTELSP